MGSGVLAIPSMEMRDLVNPGTTPALITKGKHTFSTLLRQVNHDVSSIFAAILFKGIVVYLDKSPDHLAFPPNILYNEQKYI